MKNYTIEELRGMEFDDISEKTLEAIRHSSCVKSVRKVGKKFTHKYAKNFFKKVIVTVFEEYLDIDGNMDIDEQQLEYYVIINTNTKLYVAYGSNLHLEQMQHRCPDARVFGKGVIKNYELTFWGNWNRNGVATILPDADTDVPVGVWEISASDEKSLDVYEGWPHLYHKEDIEVVMEDGSVITGMVYVMNEGRMRPALPSDSYFTTIATGYKSFGFDLDFLKAARNKISERNYNFTQLW